MWRSIIEGLPVIKLPATKLPNSVCHPHAYQNCCNTGSILYSLFSIFWKKNWTFQKSNYIYIRRNSNLSMSKCSLPVKLTAACCCPFCSSLITLFAALPSAGCQLHIGDMRLRARSHRVSNPKFQVTWGQSVQSQPLRAWKLGFITSHRVPSPKSHECFCINNQDPFLMIISHILMVSWGSKVGTLPPCWDLLTWVGLGTWDSMWTNLEISFSFSLFQLWHSLLSSFVLHQYRFLVSLH